MNPEGQDIDQGAEESKISGGADPVFQTVKVSDSATQKKKSGKRNRTKVVEPTVPNADYVEDSDEEEMK